jgi:hypothetical protein
MVYKRYAQRTLFSVEEWPLHISELYSSWTPVVFYTCFYNHAHRPRLENLLCTKLPRSSSGYFKPLLDPGGGFTSKTAARRFQKRGGYKFNSCMSRPFPNGQNYPPGCNGYVTAMAVGQRQRLYRFWCQNFYRELSQFHSEGTSPLKGPT